MAVAIEVREVQSRKDRDAFIEFPWQIYRTDPVWVPPLILERKTFLDRERHPFYRHGDAALFLAYSSDRIVGRIMASDDPHFNSLHGTNTGAFGMFECVNDCEVATALFKAASGWLRDRGRTEIRGPIDYSMNYVCGLLIEGFEHPPMILTSHNPPYYAALLEACGFTKAKDLYALWISDPERAARRLRRIAPRLQARDAITIRSGDVSNIENEGERLREVYNQAWSENWGFVPFTKEEFQFMTRELKPLVKPEFTLIAEIEGQPAGFILCLPDINVALRHVNGRLTRFGIPIGLAKLLYYKRRTKTARLIALGVVPKYRRHGIAETLVLQIIEDGMIKQGFTGELSLTLEDNHLINRFVAAIGARKYKTYRIYSRSVDEEDQA